MKFRSTAVGAAAVAAALAATLAPHPIAGASAHPAARWSATWASASPAGFLRAEAVRDQVNHWIRTSGAFDAVADFAKAVADPADPTELNPAYNRAMTLI